MTAPDADGWIEWSGGECPVDRNAMIRWTTQDGRELFWRYASAHDWSASGFYREFRP